MSRDELDPYYVGRYPPREIRLRYEDPGTIEDIDGASAPAPASATDGTAGAGDLNQHSERLREAIEQALGYTPGGELPAGVERELHGLIEQVQSLELACDHHKMFWQKAEERERGLKEQLETLQRQADANRKRADVNWNRAEEAVEQLEALEQRNDELLTRVTERVPVDYVEGLKGQLEALQAGLVRARLNHDISEHVYREILDSNPASSPDGAELELPRVRWAPLREDSNQDKSSD